MKIKIRTIIILSYLLIILSFSLGILLIVDEYALHTLTKQHISYASAGIEELTDKNRKLTEKLLLELNELLVDVYVQDSAQTLHYVIKELNCKNNKELIKNNHLRSIIYQPIILENQKVGHTGLFDSKGKILLHPDTRLEGENIGQWKDKFPGLWDIFERAMHKEKSRGYYKFWAHKKNDIVRKYMAVRRIPETDLYLCSYMNLENLLEPINGEYHKIEKKYEKMIRKNIENHAVEVLRVIEQVCVFFIVILSLCCGLFGFWLSRRITLPIMKLRNAVQQLGKGDFNPSVDVRGSVEISDLSNSFNNLGKQLTKYIEKLKKEIEARHLLETELEIAHDIQQEILQAHRLQDKREEVDLFAKLYPAKNVAGDFYDFFYLDEKKRNKLAVLIADVSGKGIYAAIFMAMAKTVMKNLCQQYPDDPAEVLRRANKLYLNSKSMFVTIFLGFYDLETGELVYANGGHHNAVHVKKGGEYENFGVFFDPLLGIFPDNEYHSASERFNCGDILFLYTDGLNEAVNLNNDEFGEERLRNIVLENRNEPLEKMSYKIFEAVKEHEQGRRMDDVTMLILKRTK